MPPGPRQPSTRGHHDLRGPDSIPKPGELLLKFGDGGIGIRHVWKVTRISFPVCAFPSKDAAEPGARRGAGRVAFRGGGACGHDSLRRENPRALQTGNRQGDGSPKSHRPAPIGQSYLLGKERRFTQSQLSVIQSQPSGPHKKNGPARFDSRPLEPAFDEGIRQGPLSFPAIPWEE